MRNKAILLLRVVVNPRVTLLTGLIWLLKLTAFAFVIPCLFIKLFGASPLMTFSEKTSFVSGLLMLLRPKLMAIGELVMTLRAIFRKFPRGLLGPVMAIMAIERLLLLCWMLRIILVDGLVVVTTSVRCRGSCIVCFRVVSMMLLRLRTFLVGELGDILRTRGWALIGLLILRRVVTCVRLRELSNRLELVRWVVLLSALGGHSSDAGIMVIDGLTYLAKVLNRARLLQGLFCLEIAATLSRLAIGNILVLLTETTGPLLDLVRMPNNGLGESCMHGISTNLTVARISS